MGVMMMDVTTFYDNMASQYAYIFADWQASVRRQSGILKTLLVQHGIEPPATVLDCTCGIGNQAFGLALAGYAVNATDLSPRAIKEAQARIPAFDLAHPPQFAVADLLNPPDRPTTHDAVIAFDNAIAHFMDDDDLLRAIQTMILQAQTGSLIAISIRDYDAIIQNPPTVTPISIRGTVQPTYPTMT